MDKLISIIIPSCNMEAYLAKNLESLIVPTIDEIEILVINDGSHDGTSNIAHSYASKYPHSIRVIDKSNGHYGSCINRGLAEATGKYVKVMDADDSFDTDNFQRFVSFLKETEADAVLSDYCIVDEAGEITRVNSFGSPQCRMKSFAEALPLLKQQIMAMHAIAYRTELLRKNHYRQTEGVAYTDQEWIFLPILWSQTFAVFPEVVYRYLVGRAGQSVSKENLSKAMPLMLKHHNKRIDDFESIASPDKLHISYATTRLLYSLKSSYGVILFNKDRSLDSALKALDQRVKSIMPDLYESLGITIISKKLPFKYIQYWRNSKYKTGSLIFSILRKLLN